MSGSRLLFDTNAIISLLKGNSVLDNISSQASWIATSAINIVEFLFFPSLDAPDRRLFNQFVERVTVLTVPGNNITFLEEIASIRKTYKLKLPDAIIAGTAIHHNAALITNDRDFSQIRSLQIIHF
jgi:tRNA(fMet)-specific endonuclease VapC